MDGFIHSIERRWVRWRWDRIEEKITGIVSEVHIHSSFPRRALLLQVLIVRSIKTRDCRHQAMPCRYAMLFQCDAMRCVYCSVCCGGTVNQSQSADNAVIVSRMTCKLVHTISETGSPVQYTQSSTHSPVQCIHSFTIPHHSTDQWSSSQVDPPFHHLPSPSLSKRENASLNSAICSSVSCSAILIWFGCVWVGRYVVTLWSLMMVRCTVLKIRELKNWMLLLVGR